MRSSHTHIHRQQGIVAHIRSATLSRTEKHSNGDVTAGMTSHRGNGEQRFYNGPVERGRDAQFRRPLETKDRHTAVSASRVYQFLRSVPKDQNLEQCISRVTIRETFLYIFECVIVIMLPKL